MNKEKLDLLIFSLDNALSTEQESELETALAASAELLREKEQLLATRALLQGLQPPPAEGFADQVMKQVQYQQSTDLGATIVRLFPKVAAACIIVIVTTLATIYMMEGSLSADAILGVRDLSLEDAYGLADY